MSYEAGSIRNVSPPKFWSKPEEMARKTSDAVRGVLLGQTNNNYTVTLDAGGDCTTIPYPSSRPGVSVQITPQNQVAAAFARTNDVWAEAEAGQVKVCHDISAAGDEKFSIIIVG